MEIREAFWKNIDDLRTGDRVALKRSAGIMLREADGKAIVAFFKCHPGVQEQEEKWFAVACFKTMYDPSNEQGKPLENILRTMEMSDSMMHRIEALLDTPWDRDGYLLTKLARMVKLVKQKTNQLIDFDSLLQDLIYWNSDSQSVQRKWARTIFGPIEQETEE